MNTRTVLAVTFAGLAACGSSNPGDTTGTTGPTGSTGPGQAAVNVQLQGSGAVDVVTQTGAQTCQGSCTTQVVQGSTVLLVPHAGNGFSFQGFQGNLCNGSAVQGSNDCNLTVNGDLTVIIMFQALPPPPPSQQTLAVNRTGNGVCVVVATSIGLDCGTDCQRDVAAGTEVTLVAQPDKDSAFTGWKGACDGSKDPTCTVKMDQSRTVSARCMKIVCAVDP
jgi:hypothetical protein